MTRIFLSESTITINNQRNGYGDIHLKGWHIYIFLFLHLFPSCNNSARRALIDFVVSTYPSLHIGTSYEFKM